MSLDLSFNPIGPNGIAALLDALRSNDTLVDLNLDGIPMNLTLLTSIRDLMKAKFVK
jgi:hypothetical protein